MNQGPALCYVTHDVKQFLESLESTWGDVYNICGHEDPFKGTRVKLEGLLEFIESFKDCCVDDPEIRSRVDIFKKQLKMCTAGSNAQMISEVFEVNEEGSVMQYMAGCIRCYKIQDEIYYDYMLISTLLRKSKSKTKMIAGGAVIFVGIAAGIALCFTGPVGVGVGVGVAIVSAFTGTKLILDAHHMEREDVQKYIVKAFCLLDLKKKGHVSLDLEADPNMESVARAIFDVAPELLDLPRERIDIVSEMTASPEEVAVAQELDVGK